MAADRIEHPAPIRGFSSPDGHFRLSVSASDGWRTPQTLAVLEKSGRQVWSQTLPHEYGPRRALVSDQGETLLVDEWINVLSRRALTLLDARGQVSRVWEGETILRLLQVPPREITAHARLGLWLSGEPALSADGRHVLLYSGGQTLRLTLSDGSLVRLP